jgi:UDPglucose 6-dehydrogenase
MDASRSLSVGVVGTGYVGLVSAVVFAEYGHRVLCYDNNAAKVQRLLAGDPIIYEEGLTDLMRTQQREGRLIFLETVDRLVQEADIFFLAVGTPSAPDGSVQIGYLEDALESLVPRLLGRDRPSWIVVKSTVPPGTLNRLIQRWEGLRSGAPIAWISNPEFLREGRAVQDCRFPDRIVIGAAPSTDIGPMRLLYADFVAQGSVWCEMLPSTAEMVKYASNSFLATKIAFMNEMADLCESVGASCRDVQRGLGLDPRIGPHYLQPGPGFGGSCFPKDLRGLLATGQRCGVPLPLVASVIEQNAKRMEATASRIVSLLGARGGHVAVWGLTFKAGTDDLRDSPAMAIVEILRQRGCDLSLYDPMVVPSMLDGGAWWHRAVVATPLEALARAGCLVVLTEWPMFGALDPGEVDGSLARGVPILDMRAILPVEAYRALGREVIVVGEGAVPSSMVQ